MIKTCKDRCQDTYRPPLRLGAGRLADAGRRCGLRRLLLVAAAGLSGRRRGKEGGLPPGLAVLSVASRAAGRWSAGGGNDPAAIRRYLISY